EGRVRQADLVRDRAGRHDRARLPEGRRQEPPARGAGRPRMSAPMPIDAPRPTPALPGLRIRRAQERRKRPLRLLFGGAALAVSAQAEADLARQQNLFHQGLAPKSTLDAAVALEASTRARVDYVKALLDYTVLRAPFDGVVVAKRAHVGEAVSPFGSPGQGSTNGGAIVTLVDFSTLYVGVDVNESNL